jgi:hypothetical protein
LFRSATVKTVDSGLRNGLLVGVELLYLTCFRVFDLLEGLPAVFFGFVDLIEKLTTEVRVV